jgi:hypothetical protein
MNTTALYCSLLESHEAAERLRDPHAMQLIQIINCYQLSIVTGTMCFSPEMALCGKCLSFLTTQKTTSLRVWDLIQVGVSKLPSYPRSQAFGNVLPPCFLNHAILAGLEYLENNS